MKWKSSFDVFWTPWLLTDRLKKWRFINHNVFFPESICNLSVKIYLEEAVSDNFPSRDQPSLSCTPPQFKRALLKLAPSCYLLHDNPNEKKSAFRKNRLSESRHEHFPFPWPAIGRLASAMIATEALLMSPTAEWVKDPEIGCVPPLYWHLQPDRQHFDQCLTLNLCSSLKWKSETVTPTSHHTPVLKSLIL